MQISAATVSLSSSHVLSERVERSEKIDAWVERPAATVGLSDAARAAGQLAAEPAPDPSASSAGATPTLEEEAAGDPLLNTLLLLLKAMTGRKVELLDPKELDADQEEALAELRAEAGAMAPPDRAGWGVIVERKETRESFERTDVHISATLKTEDGRTLKLDLKRMQERFERKESVETLRFGDAAAPVKDPLVLDFGLPGTSTTHDGPLLDLDLDGDLERLPGLGPTSAWLVDDRDGDGSLTDGSELFGPTTNDGYSELARLDQDGNGFVDAGDAAWSRLALWEHTPDGGRLVALASRGVGALFVGSVSAAFQLRGPDGQPSAQQRAMSFWVGENGAVGSTRRVDLLA